MMGEKKMELHSLLHNVLSSELVTKQFEQCHSNSLINLAFISTVLLFRKQWHPPSALWARQSCTNESLIITRSRDAPIPSKWWPGQLNFAWTCPTFLARSLHFLLHVQKKCTRSHTHTHTHTHMGQKLPDNSKVHGSLQKCGSPVTKLLHTTLLALRICTRFPHIWKICGHLIFRFLFEFLSFGAVMLTSSITYSNNSYHAGD
jgi:hypothetical protein